LSAPPVPREIFSQVRRIEIRTRRLVTETFGGKYLSVFKGRGMEFAEVREYAPGDDVRSIDWNVTARTGRPHVRRYQDERELTVVLACDMSGSQFFGTGAKLKKDVAAEIAALMAFAALRSNDKVGLLLFTEKPELYVPPKKGRTHALTLIRDLLGFEPRLKGTKMADSLDVLNRHLKRRSIVFLISDFLDRGFEDALKRTAVKHDLVPVILEDPRESDVPRLPAFLELEDPESGETVLFDARSPRARLALRERRLERRRSLEKFLASAGIDSIRVRADRSYADALVQFFARRARRFR